MKLFIVILALFMTNGPIGTLSLDGGSSESGKGPYTYEINAKRIEQVIPPEASVIYMYYQVSSQQNITYFVPIDEDHPFIIEPVVFVGGQIIFADYIDRPDPIKTCQKLDNNSWRYVLVEITVKNLMPEGKCPVDKGNYMIDQEVGPISVSFDQKIPCGDYEITENLYRGSTWAAQFTYEFTIPDDGNCIRD